MTLEDIALTMTPGIGVKGAVHLLSLFGDARSIFAVSEQELIRVSELRPDLARHIVQKVGFQAAEREVRYCADRGIRIVVSTDDEYPSLLRETPDYPSVLYVKGDPAALSARCLSMVGTRRNTPYGIRMCLELIRGLAERIPDLCIVSGLALGLDAESHRAALTTGAKTVAVLPCPLPDVVPSQHEHLAREIVEAGGALVTELHSQVKQRGVFYLARNRIIAGLSAGTVVVESPCGGGSLVTAQCADGYDRSVMAVPGRAGDKMSLGTNSLIRNHKAQLVLSANDIIQELQWDLGLPAESLHPERFRIELTDSESRVMACFPTTDSVSAETIGALCGVDAGELAVLLLGLEMVGALRQVPGNRYIKLIENV